MFKKLLIASVLCGITSINVQAAVSQKDMTAAQTYYEKAEYYTKNSQYSTAIDSLKKRIKVKSICE